MAFIPIAAEFRRGKRIAGGTDVRFMIAKEKGNRIFVSVEKSLALEAGFKLGDIADVLVDPELQQIMVVRSTEGWSWQKQGRFLRLGITLPAGMKWLVKHACVHGANRAACTVVSAQNETIVAQLPQLTVVANGVPT